MEGDGIKDDFTGFARMITYTKVNGQFVDVMETYDGLVKKGKRKGFGRYVNAESMTNFIGPMDDNYATYKGMFWKNFMPAAIGVWSSEGNTLQRYTESPRTFFFENFKYESIDWSAGPETDPETGIQTWPDGSQTYEDGTAVQDYYADEEEYNPYLEDNEPSDWEDEWEIESMGGDGEEGEGEEGEGEEEESWECPVEDPDCDAPEDWEPEEEMEEYDWNDYEDDMWDDWGDDYGDEWEDYYYWDDEAWEEEEDWDAYDDYVAEEVSFFDDETWYEEEEEETVIGYSGWDDLYVDEEEEIIEEGEGEGEEGEGEGGEGEEGEGEYEEEAEDDTPALSSSAQNAINQCYAWAGEMLGAPDFGAYGDN